MNQGVLIGLSMLAGIGLTTISIMLGLMPNVMLGG